MVYIQLFLLFFYFKVARVHTKQEKVSKLFLVQHVVVALSAISTIFYGFSTQPWYVFLLAMWIFFIVAALIVTAVMIGIFVNGKSLIGLSTIYKYLPVLTSLIGIFSILLWLV
ncbi:hypothetical protein [Sulfurimonas sp.]|uniref:hypothetical protein n=1 Tax=Sulfurimonas sp. TaxID=2022749 RepID=UPI003D0D4AB3